MTCCSLASAVLFAGACAVATDAAAAPATFGVGRSQIVIRSDAETELLAHTAENNGTGAAITFFWCTGDPWIPATGKSGVDYALWSYYVDGEATASVVLQTSQAAFVGQADPSAPWNNDYFGKNSKFGGWHINLPIPFSTSIRVTIKLPTWWESPTERIFAMVRGVEGMPVQIGSFVLPAGARLTASVANATLAPLGFHDLISIPAGTPGLLLGAMYDITMFGAGAGSLNTLEGCHHAYSPPDAPFPGTYLLGTGAEDYPESAYYFNAGPYRGPTSGLTVFSSSASLSFVSFYKLHHKDPVFFNNGFRMQWRNGDITDPVTGEKCTATTGNPIGTPSAANVSTLAYAYTW